MVNPSANKNTPPFAKQLRLVDPFDIDIMCECANNEYNYEKIFEIKEFISSKCSICPKIGIICGSGLGSLAEVVQSPTKLKYEDIPNFPISTIEGHKGSLVLGHISGIPVICMQGRFHYYEGYSLGTCIMPVRLMKLLGVTHLIASNAAGAVNPNYKVGDIMLVKDHYNIMGLSGIGPLIGNNDERFGPRFFSMVNAYDDSILDGAMGVAEQLVMEDVVRQGIYTCTGGPNYETVAEIRGLGRLGVDACGMSTVHEVIAARQCGIKCFAFSLITNKCSSDYHPLKSEPGVKSPRSDADHGEVLAVGRANEEMCKGFVEKLVQYIGQII